MLRTTDSADRTNWSFLSEASRHFLDDLGRQCQELDGALVHIKTLEAEHAEGIGCCAQELRS